MRREIVPCDVCIKRLYRMYVKVDEGAGRDKIEAEAKLMLTSGDDPDAELIPDPDLFSEIEAEDICWINPDFDGAWTEEDDEDTLAIFDQEAPIKSGSWFSRIKKIEADHPLPVVGRNDLGEYVIVDKGPDGGESGPSYKLITLQDNGWLRINTHYEDGSSEESYKKGA